jgi:hypothetical protein
MSESKRRKRSGAPRRGGSKRTRTQIVVREDFWTSTSNKQLNFVQHIYSLLKIDGRTSAGGVTPSAGAICFAWG